jgi:hypothetical protein
MAAARNYSSVARATTLTTSVSGSTTAWGVTETTGFPTPPFTMVADPGRPGEEAVTVTNVVGLTLTVTRGQDGTAAQPHDAGATLRHMATARDFREPAEHIDATVGVHGVTAGLVGTTDTQAIDNKTFTAAVGDHTPLIVKAASGQSAPTLVFKSAADATVASFATDGKLTTPGVTTGGTSSLVAGSSSDTPLTVKGAASQSANLVSVRNSGNTELLFIAPTGAVTAPAVTATGAVSGNTVVSTTSVTAASGSFSGRVATQGVDGSGLSVFTPSSSSTSGLVVVSPTSSSVPPLLVRDAATSTTQAGVSSETNGHRLFHGGDVTNMLPWRMHAGSVSVNILSGNNSTTDSISFSGMGFTVAPILLLTVAGPGSGQEGRVGCVILSRSTTSASVRTITTNFVNLDASQNYTVYWTAIQMTPSTAAG